ncbi:MAG: 16S rRNA (guanine(527)-N(7))-methyltransferase RsmG [Bacteroidales bacterium]|jgi:16S rRNA (guanine527-N7)-methyltransferase
MSEVIEKYFPQITEGQKEKFSLLGPLYEEWNSKINVISRKDIGNFYIHHVLHSLSIQRVISFSPGTTVLDIGTGGGFPGLPLAILFPDVRFTLLDSIHKKIRVVAAIADQLQIRNITPLRARAEENTAEYDFIISRSVSAFPEFVTLASPNVRHGGFNTLANGIICLKGGDLSQELRSFRNRVKTWDISQFFSETYFSTKQIVYLQV